MMTCVDAKHGAVRDELDSVLEFIRTARGFDATGYCPSVLATRIQGRLEATGATSVRDYLQNLPPNPAELDLLVEALTIKVSHFFRDPLSFEYLRECVLPALIARKAASGERTLRVWSAGCAHGEEPYSVAMLFQELMRQDGSNIEPIIFATDLDPNALTQARRALYPAASLDQVPHALVAAAFRQEGDGYRVLPAIAEPVRFSVHDMLDHRSASPAESVFGSFDLILCRNLLIYFQPDYQAAICEKLFRSLAVGGFLLLGRTESLPTPWAERFSRVTDCCPLFQKPARKTISSAPGSVAVRRPTTDTPAPLSER